MKKILLLVSFMLMIISSILFVKAYQSHTLVQIEDANGNNLNTILQGKMVKSGSAVNCVNGYLKGLDSNNDPLCEVSPYYFVPSEVIRRSGGNGNFGGYDGMKTKCTGANEHVCSGIELTRLDQESGAVGSVIPAGTNMLVNAGISIKSMGNKLSRDCDGWTSSSTAYHGVRWYKHSSAGTYYTSFFDCSQSEYVACCS